MTCICIGFLIGVLLVTMDDIAEKIRQNSIYGHVVGRVGDDDASWAYTDAIADAVRGDDDDGWVEL